MKISVNNPDIFDKSIILQIGNCRIIDAFLICNDDKSVTLAIENSATNGIVSTSLDKYISEFTSDENVWIFSDEISQVYFSDTNIKDALNYIENRRQKHTLDYFKSVFVF